MESAKEKAIREAWVKLIGEEEFKTMSVDEHGFSKSSYLRLIPDSEYRDSVIQSTLIKGKMHYRPKSLQGVDNNNGWTRIYSIEQIQEHADCDTEHIAVCHIDNKTYDFVNGEELVELYKSNAVTHYEKPKLRSLPIY